MRSLQKLLIAVFAGSALLHLYLFTRTGVANDVAAPGVPGPKAVTFGGPRKRLDSKAVSALLEGAVPDPVAHFLCYSPPFCAQRYAVAGRGTWPCSLVDQGALTWCLLPTQGRAREM